jgi:hypothetical protein
MKIIQSLASIALVVLLSISCSSSDNSSDNSTPNCDQYIAATAAAQQAYTNSNTSQNCNNYKTALQNQIANCGDANGSLLAIVNSLGNCTVPTVTGTLSMNTGSVPHVFDLITVTTTGTTRHVRGQKSSSTSYEINFDVVVGQTGANKIINFEFRGLSQTYFPLIPTSFGNPWTSTITVNSGTSIEGTFRGDVANAGQTSAQDIINGIVNINF